MKKILLPLLIILLIFPCISAVEIEMNSNFSQGETLIAKISGYFFEPILEENVLFYRGHVKIPLDYTLTKIQETYYIYASLSGKSPDNYSLSIEGLRYLDGAETKEDDIVKEFQVLSDYADFSVTPGVISAESDFIIEFKNLKDKQLEIKSSKGENLEIEPAQTKDTTFSLELFDNGLNTLELETNNTKYEIPVYVSKEIPSGKTFFTLDPSNLEITLPTGSKETRTIYLYNNGDTTLTDISISIPESLQTYMTLQTTSLSELQPEQEEKIEFTISSKKEAQMIEDLTVEAEGLKSTAKISLTFEEDYVTPEEDPTAQIKTCSQLGGQICQEDENCNDDEVQAKDSLCCLGTCNKSSFSGTGIIIGILILVVIAVIAFWFYNKKYKKAKKPFNLLKIAKGKKT